MFLTYGLFLRNRYIAMSGTSVEYGVCEKIANSEIGRSAVSGISTPLLCVMTLVTALLRSAIISAAVAVAQLPVGAAVTGTLALLIKPVKPASVKPTAAMSSMRASMARRAAAARL